MENFIFCAVYNPECKNPEMRRSPLKFDNRKLQDLQFLRILREDAFSLLVFLFDGLSIH